jgi:hypothetical protein
MTKTTVAMRKRTLQEILSDVAGVAVEVTVRGLKAFTFSFDGEDKDAAYKIASYFFGTDSTFEDADYDAECNQTCIYMTI